MCRSPAAEKLLAAEKLPGVEVRSRGAAVQPYGGMPRQVRAFLEREGISDLAHKPALIAEEDVNWADLILVMENAHYDHLAERFPQSQRKMHLFVDYCAGREEAELEDPMGKGDAAFERVLNMVRFCIKGLAAKLKPPPGPLKGDSQ